MSSSDETDAVVRTFRSDFKSRRLANAYLLIGAPGGDARRLAERILRVIYCESDDPSPCAKCKCSGCSRVSRRIHPDMMWVEPRKKSRTIQRDQVLAARRHVCHAPYEGDVKSVVLMDAERMNDVAANTFLKTLEEPPDSALFILFSETPESLLPTVLSRCRRVIVAGPTDSSSRQPAEAGNASGSEADEPEAGLRSAVADIMAKTFAGDEGIIAGMARSRMLLDILKQHRKRIESEQKDLLKQVGNEGCSSEDTKDILAGRVEAQYVALRDSVLRCLLHWCRDMLLAVCGVDESAFYFREHSAIIREMGDRLNRRSVLDNMCVVEEMKRQLDQHVGETMVFDRGMLELRNRVTPGK